MRDKLVNLIVNADTYESYGCKLCTKKDVSCTQCGAEKLADYLLVNGVIVPPCRCKDCAYLRESDTTNRMFCTYHGDSYEFETQPNNYCSNGVGMVKGA